VAGSADGAIDDRQLHELGVNGDRDAARAPRERRQWDSKSELRDRGRIVGGPTAAQCRRCWRWRVGCPRVRENATARTPLVWPARVAVRWLLAGSHSRTVPSLLALASWLPSGENATTLTRSVGPARVAVRWLLAGSHSRTVPSPPALASWRPSGENATALTPWVGPARVAVRRPLSGSHSRTVPSPPAKMDTSAARLAAHALHRAPVEPVTAPDGPLR
jgi:hypothetical protein